MRMASMIRSEQIKIKHTVFGILHILIPVIGAFVFLTYYMLYPDTDGYKKLKLILEITATVIPLFVSVIVGINLLLEEKASCFQNLLVAANRRKFLLVKLFFLYGAGIVAFTFLFFCFVALVYIFGMFEARYFNILVKAVVGIIFSNLIIYMFHLFLNLKFGLWISLFWGLFESMQCILYSNIELHGLWRYIPFAWSMNWIHDVLDSRGFIHMVEWKGIAVITLSILLLVGRWFSKWEGRKSFE